MSRNPQNIDPMGTLDHVLIIRSALRYYVRTVESNPEMFRDGFLRDVLATQELVEKAAKRGSEEEDDGRN